VTIDEARSKLGRTDVEQKSDENMQDDITAAKLQGGFLRGMLSSLAHEPSDHPVPSSMAFEPSNQDDVEDIQDHAHVFDLSSYINTGPHMHNKAGRVEEQAQCVGSHKPAQSSSGSLSRLSLGCLCSSIDDELCADIHEGTFYSATEDAGAQRSTAGEDPAQLATVLHDWVRVKLHQSTAGGHKPSATGLSVFACVDQVPQDSTVALRLRQGAMTIAVFDLSTVIISAVRSNGATRSRSKCEEGGVKNTDFVKLSTSKVGEHIFLSSALGWRFLFPWMCPVCVTKAR